MTVETSYFIFTPLGLIQVLILNYFLNFDRPELRKAIVIRINNFECDFGFSFFYYLATEEKKCWCLLTRLLFCAAPHLSITTVCSFRILTLADILSVVLYNQLKSILYTLVISEGNQ